MKSLILRIYFLLTGLEGLLVAGVILRTPSEQGDALLLGLTPERLVLLLGVLLAVSVPIYAFVLFWLKTAKFRSLQKRIETIAQCERLLAILTLLAGVLLIVGAQIYQYAAASTDLVHQAYFTRLQPLILWLAALMVQTVVSLLLLRYGKRIFRRKILRVVLIFGFFLLAWGWIAQSGYGFTEETPETGIFHHPNAPIMGVQVFLAWGVAMLFGVLWYGLGLLRQRWPWLRFLHNDLLIGVVIWLVTYIVWMGIPLTSSWFANPPLPPTYSFSPNSDAFRYDSVAQSILAGQGFRVGKWSEMVERPMLSFWLAVFHAISGLGYESILGLQVAVLSFIPVLAYRLTKSLHNHISGMLVALMIMLRERNAILLGDTITVSHAKLLLSELPAMLGVLMFLWLFVEWSKKPDKRGVYALLAGGVMGFFMLIRQEIGAIVFLVGFGALLVMVRKPATGFAQRVLLWSKGMVLVFVGIILMVGPWVWRDYSIAPHNREAWLIRNDPDRMLQKFWRLITPDEQADFWDGSRLSFNWEEAVVKVDLKPSLRTLENDINSDVLLNHLVDSSVQSVLYLPINNRILLPVEYSFEHHPPMSYKKLCCELERFVRDTPYWWPQWSGDIPTTSYVPLGLTLLLLAVGIGAVWQRQKLIGLFPLLALFAHIIIFALMKRSGGRFLVVTDWASAMYYGIGLTELSMGFWGWMNIAPIDPGEQKKLRESSQAWNTKWMYGLVILVILLIGSAPPMVEKIIPERYTSEQKQIRLDALLHEENNLLTKHEREIWDSMLSSGGSVMYGRALAPIYYQPGTAKLDAGFRARQKPSRIEFYLIGTKRRALDIPTHDWMVDFPYGSDVMVLGCSTDIVSVAIYEDDGENLRDVLWREPILEYPVTCPLPGE
ncbi:MAG: hypothetical protein U9Q82_12410 [Chloroflexota bacterium]|nr:hypothetical protein [Chloroflexota bacterium]